ncbi:Arb2 domain containing protein [Naviculisporaceae sp. PSN 640]
MFRRKWSGLPADPIFGSDLAELGYFVNDEDEIRSLDDPDSYFKFFLTKNQRWNERQRFCFNSAIGQVLRQRLDNEGLKKVMLPLGTTDPSQPNLEIRVSEDIDKKSRVVIFLGENNQEFGVLAHRVLGGKGGVNKGSVISLIQELKKQQSSAKDASPPGIIIANPGEMSWWPEGKRTLTIAGRHAIPMSSAVQIGYHFTEKKHRVSENRDSVEHIRYMLEKVVPALVPETAKLDIITISTTAEEVQEYLSKDEVWSKLEPRMNSLTIVGGWFDQSSVESEGFKKFLIERSQAYVQSGEDIGALAALDTTSGGAVNICPTYSAGSEALVSELLFIHAMTPILEWTQKISLKED